MKKVDFNKLQAGDLVEVPRTQFAPMRSGWNGWLFSEAVVIIHFHTFLDTVIFQRLLVMDTHG